MAKRDRGQIIKKGPKKYQLKVYLGRFNGKRKYVSKTVNCTKKDALAQLTKWLRQLDLDTFVAPSDSPRVAEAAESVLKVLEQDYSHAHYRTMAMRVEQNILPRLGHYRLNQLRSGMLTDFFRSVQQENDYSKGTMQKVRTALSLIIKHGLRHGYMTHNPLTAAEMPKMEKATTKGRSMSVEEMHRVLEAAKDGPAYGIFATMLYTGLRPQEAAALKWDDIDLEEGQIHLRRVWGRFENQKGSFIKDIGKTKGALKTISMPQVLVEILREERVEQLRALMEAGERNEEGWVFLAGRLNTWSGAGLRHRWQKTLEDAGMDRKAYRLYDCRHTHATLLLANGAPMAAVQARLRHRNIQTTIDTYSHAQKAQDEAATALWDRIEAAKEA